MYWHIHTNARTYVQYESLLTIVLAKVQKLKIEQLLWDVKLTHKRPNRIIKNNFKVSAFNQKVGQGNYVALPTLEYLSSVRYNFLKIFFIRLKSLLMP